MKTPGRGRATPYVVNFGDLTKLRKKAAHDRPVMGRFSGIVTP
jgi:hypothetical protein